VVDDGGGIADGDVGAVGVEFFEVVALLDDLERAPGFAAVLRAFLDEVDLGGVSARAGFAESEEVAVGGLDDGGDAEVVVALFAPFEDGDSREGGGEGA
jgi:hypothetical protein